MIKERNRVRVRYWRRPASALAQAKSVQRSSARSKGLTIVLVTCCLLVTSGCYSFVSMSKVPPQSDALTPVRTQERLAPAYMMSIQVSLDGTRTNPAPTVESRFVGLLQEAGLFSDVVSILGRDRRPPNEVHFDITLHTDEVPHPHHFANGVKVCLVGVSLGLLAPILPFNYEYEATTKLFVTLPTGAMKQYGAHAQGSVYFTPFDDEAMLKRKLMNQVVDNCFVSVVNQLAHDSTLRVSGSQ